MHAPKIEYQEEIVERHVEQMVTAQKTVKVPQTQKRQTKKPVEQIVEEIAHVPKIEYQEETVERQVKQVVTVQGRGGAADPEVPDSTAGWDYCSGVFGSHERVQSVCHLILAELQLPFRVS